MWYPCGDFRRSSLIKVTQLYGVDLENHNRKLDHCSHAAVTIAVLDQATTQLGLTSRGCSCLRRSSTGGTGQATPGQDRRAARYAQAMPSVRGVWREHVAYHNAPDAIRAVARHIRGMFWCQEPLHPHHSTSFT